MRKLLLWFFIILAAEAFAQQPQTHTAPLFAVNAKYTNGVAPGYAPTAGAGLTLNLGPGTTDCLGALIEYAGGTLTMTNSTVNYVYLDPVSSCAPTSSTSIFTSAHVWIAKVTTSGGAITAIDDVRTSFLAPGTGAAGITSITCGTGMSGGTITTSGTCNISMVPLANGGTNADLSGTGGAVNTTGKQVLVQGADHAIGPRALIAADLPAIPLSGLATQSPDTIVMNATGGSAAPTAVAGPSGGTNGCAGTTDASTYNSTTHAWGCHQITPGAGTVTHTGNLTLHALVLGNGTADEAVLGSLGTTTTVLHGNASGNPSFGAVVDADLNLTAPALGAATATSLLATGIVDGKAPVDITTGSSATLGGTYKSGYTLNQEATAATAVTYTLPTAAAGLQYCIKNSYNGSAADTGALRFSTSASGQYIIYNGTLSATNGYIISGGAAGDAACVVGIDSTHWEFYAQVGTWTLH